MSQSETPVSRTPKNPPKDDLDIEKILNREASAFQREVEVERILKAFKLKCVYMRPKCLLPDHTILPTSPYDILDIDEGATPEEIKKKYRQISLCAYLASVIRQTGKLIPSSYSP